MIRSRNLLRAVLLGAVFFLNAAGILNAGGPLEITVKEKATVRGDRVRLGDIATFSPSDDARVDHLRGLEISSSPSPGNKVELSSHFLIYKIGSAVGGDDSVRLLVPETLSINRTAQYLNTKELEDIFKDHILSHSPWPRDKIVFDRINTPGRMALPEGNLQWDVWERGNPDYIGNVFLTVDFRVNGQQVRKAALSGRISIRQDVVKAARKIRSGEVICEADLTLVKESHTGRNLKNVLTSVEEVVGKKATRNIQDGQRLTQPMIEEPPMVKKGKRVIIKAMNQTVQITTLGKVLEDGKAGDQVKVVNISSGREILATVTGPGVVNVHF